MFFRIMVTSLTNQISIEGSLVDVDVVQILDRPLVVVATAASTFSFQRKLQSDKIQQTSFKSSFSSFALTSFALSSLPFLSVDGSRLNPWFGNSNRNLLAHFLVHLVALLIVLCVASGFAVNFADLKENNFIINSHTKINRNCISCENDR